MAGKTNSNEETVVATPSKPEKVRYTVPMSPDPREEDTIFVSVNMKNYRIKRGVEVMLPTEVVEVIENSIKENNLAYRIAREKMREDLDGLRNVQMV